MGIGRAEVRCVLAVLVVTAFAQGLAAQESTSQIPGIAGASPGIVSQGSDAANEPTSAPSSADPSPPDPSPADPSPTPDDSLVQSQQALDSAEIDRLIRQLGAPRFIDRQMATETLSTLGLKAAGPVREALKSSDPEIRFRAHQILRVIRHDDRQRLINAFIAGVDIESEAELPGWIAFQAIAGTSGDARQLYVQMLEEEWTFLDLAHQVEPAAASGHLASRVTTLELGARQDRAVSVGSIAALLLVASHEDVQLSNQANLMSLCYRSPEFDSAIRSGPFRDPLRALMGQLIGKSSASPYLTQRFHFSLYYELKEGLEPARQVVTERLGIPHVRQYAVLVLGKLGTDADLELVERMLDDVGVVSSHNRVNRVRITTQVRDVALAVLLHRHGEKFTDYGLPEFKGSTTTLMQTSQVGFADDEQREKALTKWFAFKEQQTADVSQPILDAESEVAGDSPGPPRADAAAPASQEEPPVGAADAEASGE